MMLRAHKVQKNIYDTARMEEAVDIPGDRGGGRRRNVVFTQREFGLLIGQMLPAPLALTGMVSAMPLEGSSSIGELST